MIDIDALEALAKAALSRGEEDCESLDDWLSADEFMSSMLLHPIDARFAEAMTPSAILALIAEVRALREDAARLDYLEVTKPITFTPASSGDVWTIYLDESRGSDECFSGATFRAAIDTARKEPQ